MKITLDTEGMPKVFETHLCRLTYAYHADGGTGKNESDILGLCQCGWESERYPFPDTWFDDHPTRVLIREEIWGHIIEMLAQEASG